RYNCGVVTSTSGSGGGTGAWDGTKQFFTNIPQACAGVFTNQDSNHALFQSDHCFDGFISPVTNPFYFEDPRSLTEARPVFLWQQTPCHTYIFRGGDIVFFGVQGRLAITDRLSIVMNKLGGIWLEEHFNGGQFFSHAGMAEINIGPKFTFLRNDQWGTL